MVPKKFLCFVAFLCAVNTALAIQCYSCDSSQNVVCNVGLLSFTQNVVDCSASDGSFLGAIASFIPKNCIKLVAIGEDGSEYVARNCGVNTGILNSCDAIAKGVKFMQGKEIRKIDCYTCDTDKCNSASSFSSTAVVGILAACFLFLF